MDMVMYSAVWITDVKVYLYWVIDIDGFGEYTVYYLYTLHLRTSLDNVQKCWKSRNPWIYLCAFLLIFLIGFLWHLASTILSVFMLNVICTSLYTTAILYLAGTVCVHWSIAIHNYYICSITLDILFTITQ